MLEGFVGNSSIHQKVIGQPSLSKFIVVNEKAILSARMAKIRTFTRILEIVAEESGFSSATM